MNYFSQLNWRRLKRLPEVLSPKEKQTLVIFFVLLIASGLFLTGQWLWFRSAIVAAKGGEYTEALIGNPIYVNPILAQTNDVDTDLARLIFSSLLKFDRYQGLVNDLAEKFTVSEDQKIYTLQIKKNVRWHDNTPLDADDIIFTIKSIQDPQFKSPLLLSLQGVAVEKIDDYTLKLSLKKPFAPFPSLLTFGIIPEHLWANIPPANFTLAELNVKPVGSGAWLFRSLAKDKQGTIRAYTLERNPNYYDAPPLLDKITFKFYPTVQEALTAAQNKEVLGINFVPKKLAGQLPKNFATVSLRLPQYIAIFFNQKKNPLLKELEVRQALALTLNKPEIVNQAIDGEGEVIDGPILPGFIGYKSDLAKYQFDLEKAKETLDKAGWKEISEQEYVDFIKDQRQKAKTAAEAAQKAAEKEKTKQAAKETGLKTQIKTETEPAQAPETAQAAKMEEEPIETEGQKIFRKKQASILEISLTTVDHPENRKAAELIKAAWQSIGLKVKINLVDPVKIQKDVIKPRQYEALLYGEIIGSDPDPFAFWHSSQSEDPGLNLSLFEDKEADRLLIEARQTNDLKIRETNYQRFQDILVKQLPAIFLYSPTYTYALDKRIKGFEIKQINIPADRFNDLAKWYLRTKRVFRLL